MDLEQKLVDLVWSLIRQQADPNNCGVVSEDAFAAAADTLLGQLRTFDAWRDSPAAHLAVDLERARTERDADEAEMAPYWERLSNQMGLPKEMDPKDIIDATCRRLASTTPPSQDDATLASLRRLCDQRLQALKDAKRKVLDLEYRTADSALRMSDPAVLARLKKTMRLPADCDLRAMVAQMELITLIANLRQRSWRFKKVKLFRKPRP